MNNLDIITLRNDIEKLDKTKQLEIFKIFSRNNIVYSENKNGVFINLSEVDNLVLIEIKKYLDYIDKQEHHIEIFENKKKDIEKTFHHT